MINPKKWLKNNPSVPINSSPLIRVSFFSETIFSHPSKIDFLAMAKAFGYEIILVSTHLQNDELNSVTVKARKQRRKRLLCSNFIVQPRSRIFVGWC